MKYYCLCDEIGENGTFHTHIFLIANSGVMFETVKNRFPKAHIEAVKGSNVDNYNYIRKIGDKHIDKKETNLPDTFEESGKLPEDRASSLNISEDIIEMIKNGCSDADILNEHPSSFNKIPHIQKAREIFKKEKYKNFVRKIEVKYYYGKDLNEIRDFIYNTFGFDKIYRVPDYKYPFDNYDGQEVIVFDNFFDSLSFENINAYLDPYPLQLPARYSDKTALFTKVFILSTIPFECQFMNIQNKNRILYENFKSKFQDIVCFDERG